ncbi:SDR family NAD(P)-dependent oxidoreductase [Curtobacterium sp. USHLN213]|uniref:SDR family NAD(P)-dependent oxidoreductase n=1 Tax=Curtobacterium sp. USHLN213 TaxID=3081255 RepID=UPI0030179E22
MTENLTLHNGAVVPRTAVITGAGRREGLGFETARQLGEQGFHVILTARSLQQVEPLAAELNADGIAASALQLDLLDPTSATAAANEVRERFGTVDVLVNNAAMMINSPTVQQKDIEELTREFQTNVIGTWTVTAKFHPLLAASGHGRVVNVSSGAGSFGDPDYGLADFPGAEMAKFGATVIGAYAITKAAVNAFTIKASKDFADDHILVNSVCPGVVATRPGTENFARPVHDGAAGIVWAATLPDDGPTGLFFRDGQQLPW